MTWVRALKRTVLAVSEEFYRVTLEVSPGAGSPASCASIVSSMQSMVTDGPNDGPFGSLSIAVTLTPSSYPAVIVTTWSVYNGGTFIGSHLATSAPYTTLGGFKAPAGEATHTLTSGDYRAISSGNGGTFTQTWSGVNGNWAFGAIAIPTAATSPVQSKEVQGTTETVVLDSTPTPGNILVLCSQVEPIGGGSPPFPHPPSDWTRVAAAVNSHASVDICVRCVQAGDGTSYGVGTGDPLQCYQISEWALT